VTLFSRGKTGTDLFPELNHRIGDRESGAYDSLFTGSWDAVVDVSGYVPRHVGQAADAPRRPHRPVPVHLHGLGLRPGRHQRRHDRGTPRGFAPERGTEEITGETYGPLKVACEDDVLARFADQGTIVRPGIVAGPHDPTDRFTYWVRRGRTGRSRGPAGPAGAAGAGRRLP